LVDEEFLNKYSHLRGMAIGSCALFVAVEGDELCVGNVGDSLAIVGRRSGERVVRPIIVNNEHNTNNEEEVLLLRARTADPHPLRETPNGTEDGSRVGGILSVTRSLGDGLFKKAHMSFPTFEKYLPYLTNEPEVTRFKITPEDEFVIICSDGLFEQVAHGDVISWVNDYLSENKSSKEALTKAAEVILNKLFEILAGLCEMTVEELKVFPNKKRMFDDATLIIVFFNQRS